MRVIRLLPLGFLVAAGVAAVGCGEGGSAPTTEATQSDLMVRPRVNPFESVVKQRNLASDLPIAKNLVGTLINGWGVSFDPRTGLAWVSSNGNGSAELLTEDGVSIRSISMGTCDMPPCSSPTGNVFNPTNAFKSDDFIFVTEDGVIFGVKRTDTSVPDPRVPATDGANYKGVAIGNDHGKEILIVANFSNPDLGGPQIGTIDVFDAHYNPDHSFDGVFVDPDATANGLSPFNVKVVGDFLIVSYAERSADEAKDNGPNGGMVDVYSINGRKLITQLIPFNNGQGPLNAPWAMDFGPDRDDRRAPDFVVGNFGDGHINVFELSVHGKKVSATFEGALGDKSGNALVIEGLWGFAFGNGRGGFSRDDLYFAAGPNDESNGLFGELDFGPRR